MSEGTAEFHVPGIDKPCSTWYKIVGDLTSDKTPLVTLHGGPGACHDYLLPLVDLATKASIPLVFYDQLGNGKSTHLPERNGDEAFWTVALFKAELDNLLRHLGLDSRPIDLYGQSWGGMLASEWASSLGETNSDCQLRRLILSNSLASIDAWSTGLKTLIKKLSQEDQLALEEAEKTGDFESPQYQSAMDTFYQRHLCLARPWPPPEVEAALGWFAADPTTYGTMYGPSEITITGSLRDWTVVDKLHNIKVPTLLINGTEDEAQDVAMRPFFERIDKVKWITMERASHFSHVDRREDYMQHLLDFLQ